MPDRRILDIYKGYRSLKKRRAKLAPDQYLKELELLKLDLEAQLGETDNRNTDLSGLINLLSSARD